MRTFVNYVFFLAIFYLIMSIAIINGFGTTTISSVSQPTVAGASAYAFNVSGSELIDLINQERIRQGVSQLSMSSQLSTIAATRATDMIENRYYSHISDNGSDYTSLFNEKSSFSCENLDLSSSDSPDYIFNDWLNSPSHKSCLLDPRAERVGLVTQDYLNNYIRSDRTYISVLILAK